MRQHFLERELRVFDRACAANERVGELARVSNAPCTAIISATTRTRSVIACRRCGACEREQLFTERVSLGKPARSIGPASGPPKRKSCKRSLIRLYSKSYDVRGFIRPNSTTTSPIAIGRCFVPLLEREEASSSGRDMRPSGREALRRVCPRRDRSRRRRRRHRDGFDRRALLRGRKVRLRRRRHDHGLAQSRAVQRHEIHARRGAGDLARHRPRARFATASPPATFRRKPRTAGTISERNILDDFARALPLVHRSRRRSSRSRSRSTPATAWPAKPCRTSSSILPCEVVPLYFELDGSFPNHPASPIEPENMIDLQAAVRKHGCDLGVAFDGDADRMFIVDEKGDLIDGSMVTALVALNTLKKYPGAKILYNLICSRSVPELIEKAGGIPMRSQVGHSIIKNDDARARHRLRRRAQRTLLLSRQLVRRFGHDRAAAVPRSSSAKPASRSARSSRRSTRASARARSTARQRRRRQARKRFEEHYNDAQIDHLDGVTISYPALVDERAAVEHRAAAAAQRRGRHQGADGAHRDEALALIRELESTPMRCGATTQTRDELLDARLACARRPVAPRRAPHAIAAARERLERATFVLAVVGEFSSGKSFLLNALLGKFRTKTAGGAHRRPARDRHQSVDRHDHRTRVRPQTTSRHAHYEDGRTERIPLDRLIASSRSARATPARCTTRRTTKTDAPSRVRGAKRDSPFLQRGFVVADTPGLASINPAHRRATLHFLPGADAVLYLIDTQQPFTEGDASFLGHHPPAHRHDLHRADENRSVGAARRQRKTRLAKRRRTHRSNWPPCTRPARTCMRVSARSVRRRRASGTIPR